MNDEPDLRPVLARVLKLLKRTEPKSQKGDMTWCGPYFITRRGEWWPSKFVLYRDELHCVLDVGWSSRVLVWKVGTGTISFNSGLGLGASTDSGPDWWQVALDQIERRLRDAVARPRAYNRRVERLLPMRCRTGRIRRKWTWPVGAPKPLSARELRRLDLALRSGARARAWRKLSVACYLKVAACAYDAVFPDLAALVPIEKYRWKADRRHGGMLELPLDDDRAFERWHDSREWLGAHPWEIVFAHPHGVLLSPLRGRGGWRFLLSVDAVGLYIEAARMATAIGERGMPVELTRAADVIAALRGEDWVEVGPFYGQLSLDELTERRAEGPSKVEWDPAPRIASYQRRSCSTTRSPSGTVMKPGGAYEPGRKRLLK